jgi:hypothetical protein
MKRYDPLQAPDPEEWLSLDEDERIALVSYYHRRAKPRPPNAPAHAAIHVIVENQIALGDEYPVQRTADRLIDEGLDRHEAIHAIGSVLVGQMHEISQAPTTGADLNERYLAALAQLTAAGWWSGDA